MPTRAIHFGGNMRSFTLLCVVVLCACSNPCSRESKAAFIGLGGPVGIIFAALEQCETETPPQQPIAVVDASGLQVPEQPNMAQQPDMAQSSPDLSRPADMATPPSPPDLSPITVSLAASDPANWGLAGPLTRSGSSYNVQPAYDFVKVKQLDSTITIPLVSLSAVQDRQPREIALTYSVDFSAAWGATSASCNLPGRPPSFYVKGPGSPGYSYTCVLPTVGVQFLVGDAVVYDGGGGDFGLHSHYTRTLPNGQYIPVQAGQRLALRLVLNGDVVVSGVTASASVEERF